MDTEDSGSSSSSLSAAAAASSLDIKSEEGMAEADEATVDELTSDELETDGAISTTGTGSCSKCLFLSFEEFQAASAIPMCMSVVMRANAALADMTRQRDHERTRANAADLTMSQLLDQMERATKGHNYEEMYINLRKEYDEMVLASVKVASELEALKKTAGHALNALGESRESAAAKAKSATSMLTSGTSASTATSTSMSTGDAVETEDDAAIPTGKLDLFNDIAALLDDMDRKMNISHAEMSEVELEVLGEFLEKLRLQKQEERKQVDEQIENLSTDIVRVREQLDTLRTKKRDRNARIAADPFSFVRSINPNAGGSQSRKRGRGRDDDEQQDGDAIEAEVDMGPSPAENESINIKKRRIVSHLDALGSTYFEARKNHSQLPLQQFTERLSAFTRFDNLRPICTFLYSSPSAPLFRPQQTPIVSSIAFNSDEDFFAVAGTLSEIHILNFNLDAILADDSPLRPVCTITNTDKISCVSWSPLDRSHLVATDYSGAVTVWDSGTGQCIAKYTDHRKRAWAIDHSIPSPGLYASAAEDYSIKLWHSTQSSSTATIHTKAEACAVRFNRVMDNQLAFSCADHKAYYYDIRNVSTPLAEFHGHRKTVCGVCFVTREELITQSIDSTLKLWNINSPRTPLQTFIGHENKMRFTGVDSAHDLIACGSETNAVIAYAKPLGSPALTHSFNSTEIEKEYNSFVSAVCWRRSNPILLAGNSRGVVKILGLE